MPQPISPDEMVSAIDSQWLIKEVEPQLDPKECRIYSPREMRDGSHSLEREADPWSNKPLPR